MTGADDTQRPDARANISGGDAFDGDALGNRDAADELALLRDDVLADALAKGVFPAEYADDPLVGALWTWREDLVHGPVETMPLRAASQVRVAGASTAPARERATAPTASPVRRDWSWLRMPRLGGGRKLAVGFAAATIGALSLGSVAAASSAEPGDPLWRLAKVVDGQRAQSLEAREEAFDNLHQAQSAAQNNNPQTAREHLQDALSDAEKVRTKDGKAELSQELAQLESQLTEPEDPERPSPTPERSGSPSPSPTPSESPSDSPAPSSPPIQSSTPSDTPSGSPKSKTLTGAATQPADTPTSS